MLRAIIKRNYRDGHCNMQEESFETLDFDSPDLERVLCGGGRGPDGHDIRILIGVEVLPEKGGGDAQ